MFKVFQPIPSCWIWASKTIKSTRGLVYHAVHDHMLHWLCNVSAGTYGRLLSTPEFQRAPIRVVQHRRRFSFTQCLRGRSAQGSSTGLGWWRAVWMRVGPLSTQSLHALAGSKLSSERRAVCLLNGRRDTIICWQDGTAAISLWWRRWSELFLVAAVIFATRASRLMSGGVIPASTGMDMVSVGCTHPVIIRIVSFSATSSFLVWVLRHQTDDANSAAL